MDHERLEHIAHQVVDSAVRVHRALGPGLLESVYQQCLAHELQQRQVAVRREVPVPIRYGETVLDVGFRMDMLVEGVIVVENKTVERLLPIHEAQLLTYLELSGCRIGLLLNWNVVLMKDGIKRMVLNLFEPRRRQER